MEIDDRICKVFKTCLEEQWTVDEVTDEMVQQQIEMVLVVAVMHDLDAKDLPKTSEAMAEYLQEIGAYVEEDDPDELEGDEEEP